GGVQTRMGRPPLVGVDGDRAVGPYRRRSPAGRRRLLRTPDGSDFTDRTPRPTGSARGAASRTDGRVLGVQTDAGRWCQVGLPHPAVAGGTLTAMRQRDRLVDPVQPIG